MKPFKKITVADCVFCLAYLLGVVLVGLDIFLWRANIVL